MSSVQRFTPPLPRVAKVHRHRRYRSFEIQRHHHSSKIKSYRSITVRANIRSSLQIHPESNNKMTSAASANPPVRVTKLIDSRNPRKESTATIRSVRVSNIRRYHGSIAETDIHKSTNGDRKNECSNDLRIVREDIIPAEEHAQELSIKKNCPSMVTPSQLSTNEPDGTMFNANDKLTTNRRNFLGNRRDISEEKKRRSKKRKFFGYHCCIYSPLSIFLCVLGCLVIGMGIAALVVGLVIKFGQTSTTTTTTGRVIPNITTTPTTIVTVATGTISTTMTPAAATTVATVATTTMSTAMTTAATTAISTTMTTAASTVTTVASTTVTTAATTTIVATATVTTIIATTTLTSTVATTTVATTVASTAMTATTTVTTVASTTTVATTTVTTIIATTILTSTVPTTTVTSAVPTTTLTSTVATTTVTTTVAISTVTTTVSSTTATTTVSTTTITTSTTSTPSVFNVNLLTNGDAETGPCASSNKVVHPTGWNYNGSVTQINYNNTAMTGTSSTMPSPNDPGQCFFYGQQDTYTSMWQTIDMTANVDPVLIDSQTVKFNLSAWLGGMSTQNDNTVITLTFTDEFNQTISNGTSIGPVLAVDRGSITAFVFEQTNGLVPIGARFLTVFVTMTLLQGGTNNGYADDIGVYLYQ